MSTRLTCMCGRNLRLANGRPGMRVNCPACGALLTVGGDEFTSRAPRRDERSGMSRLERDEAPSGPPWKMIGIIAGIAAPIVIAAIVLIIILSSSGTPEKTPKGGVGDGDGHFAGGDGDFGGPRDRKRDDKKRGGDQLEVQFLQSTAKGTRFAIIADRSGSMSAMITRPDPFTKVPTPISSMNCLHEELTKTLQSFVPGTFFYVSFFDDRNDPMPGGDTWVEGGKPLDPLIPWIKGTFPRGGTEPLPSFRKVFALDPLPDVIFFMTDGEFNPIVVNEVANLNAARGNKVIINTILFDNSGGLGGGAPFGGGGNRYSRMVDTVKLPDPVRKQWQYHASRFGAGGGFVPGVSRTKNMEDIAKAGGGSFTVFGRIGAGPGVVPGKGGVPTLDPVLAHVDSIQGTDPTTTFRPGSRYKSYDVVMRAGATYQIDMAADFDTYLFLLSPTGNLLASNDDGGMGLNSMLQFNPPANGTYRIQATTYSGGATGPFVITVLDRPLP